MLPLASIARPAEGCADLSEIFGQWVANADRVRNPPKIEEMVGVKIRSVRRATIWRAAGRAANELVDQAVLDAEHHVGAEIVIARDEHMRHELFEAGVRGLPTPPEFARNERASLRRNRP